MFVSERFVQLIRALRIRFSIVKIERAIAVDYDKVSQSGHIPSLYSNVTTCVSRGQILTFNQFSSWVRGSWLTNK